MYVCMLLQLMFLKQACLSKGECALCIYMYSQIFFSPIMATKTVAAWSAGPSLFIVRNIPRCMCTRTTHLPVIAFACHVYATRIGRDFAEYKVHHYFVTTHAAVVGNFIVCKSTTSVITIFL